MRLALQLHGDQLRLGGEVQPVLGLQQLVQVGQVALDGPASLARAGVFSPVHLF